MWPDDPNAVVHHKKLLPGYKKVNFDKLLSTRYFKVKLPVQTDELHVLGQATGCPVMWPGSWIELLGEVFLIILTFHFDIIRV